MKWFEGWSKGLKFRLAVAASIPLFAIAAVSAVSLISLEKIGGRLEEAYTVTIPTFDALGGILANRNGMNYYFWQAIVYSQAPEKRKVVIEKAEGNYKAMKERIAFYESTKFTEKETEVWNQFKKNDTQFFALTDEVFARLKKGTPEDDAWCLKQFDGGEWHVLVTALRKAVETNTEMYQVIAAAENKVQVDLRQQVEWMVFGLSVMP